MPKVAGASRSMRWGSLFAPPGALLPTAGPMAPSPALIIPGPPLPLPLPLDLAPPALLFQPATLGGIGRSGRAAGTLDFQGAGETLAEAVESELAVLRLGTPLPGGGANYRAEPSHDAVPRPVGQARGGSGIQADLRSGVGRVGVLPSRSAGGGEAPLELVETDHNTGRDAEVVAGGIRSRAIKHR